MMATTTTMTPSWDLLDEKDENELHKHRLLNVEEKPFKRITKRLITVSTIATSSISTPSVAGGDDESTATPNPTASRLELDLLKEDLLLDFAAFESSIARLQFLLDANARERERYQADQARILAESASVREHNSTLHATLDEARATLAQRKKFDEMADRITANRALRPRGEQRAALLKLEAECAELELESEAYKVTWRERRDQFARIMDEGMSLRRLIRDEKEEVERREGMNEEEDGGDDVDASVVASGGGGTPHDVAGLRDAGTPRPTASLGGRTPLRDRDGSQPPGGSMVGDVLKPVAEYTLGSGSHNGSRGPSPDPSLVPTAADDTIVDDDNDTDDGEVKEGDVDMYDDPKQGPPPSITVDAPDRGGDKMELDRN